MYPRVCLRARARPRNEGECPIKALPHGRIKARRAFTTFVCKYASIEKSSFTDESDKDTRKAAVISHCGTRQSERVLYPEAG